LLLLLLARRRHSGDWPEREFIHHTGHHESGDSPDGGNAGSAGKSEDFPEDFPLNSKHTLVTCSHDRHAGAILDIFNEAIVNSTALYDYQPRTLASMQAWFAAKVQGNFPVLGLEDEHGSLLAFGSFGTFRAWPAYKYSVEHSVYVHHSQRGRGLGRTVMQALIAAARERNLHAMLGGIDASNVGSIALHERLGFRHVGTLPQVGFKFGRWLDLAFYQLLLDTPAQPVDG
jgi:phosphinothricin acetyltransferase